MSKIVYKSSVECEEEITLSYVLYAEKRGDEKIYSIDMIEYGNGQRRDGIFLSDVCREEKAALSLVKLFERERVTPCTALYILDELLPI